MLTPIRKPTLTRGRYAYHRSKSKSTIRYTSLCIQGVAGQAMRSMARGILDSGIREG